MKRYRFRGWLMERWFLSFMFGGMMAFWFFVFLKVLRAMGFRV